MTEEKFNKKVKWTKGFCIFFGIIMILAFIASLASEGMSFTTIEALICGILFFLCYNFTKKEKIEGPIVGIIIGIIYIISFLKTISIFSLILGILIIWDCYSMVKYMKNMDKNMEAENVEPNETKNIDKEN